MVDASILAALITAAGTLVVAIGGAGVTFVVREIRASRRERREEHQQVWEAITELHESNREVVERLTDTHDYDLEAPDHPLEGRTFDGGER